MLCRLTAYTVVAKCTIMWTHCCEMDGMWPHGGYCCCELYDMWPHGGHCNSCCEVCDSSDSLRTLLL